MLHINKIYFNNYTNLYVFSEGPLPSVPVPCRDTLDLGSNGSWQRWTFKDVSVLTCACRRTFCSQCCPSTFQWRWSSRSWSVYKTAKIKRSSSSSSKITTSTVSMSRGTRTSGMSSPIHLSTTINNNLIWIDHFIMDVVLRWNYCSSSQFYYIFFKLVYSQRIDLILLIPLGWLPQGNSLVFF